MAIERTHNLFDLATWPFHDEDDMPETNYHSDDSDYLKSVIRQMYATEKWLVATNLAIYPPKFPKPLSPDVAVFIGVQDMGQYITSWRVDDTHHPPTVVFEFASEETAAKDANEKPTYYAGLGVTEYFLYDPRPFSRTAGTVRGWGRDQYGRLSPLQQDENGYLWSTVLQSTLKPDGSLLRLYDANDNLRPTPEEAEREAREKAEARVKEMETQLAALRERLRAAGLNPDEL